MARQKRKQVFLRVVCTLLLIGVILIPGISSAERITFLTLDLYEYSAYPRTGYFYLIYDTSNDMIGGFADVNGICGGNVYLNAGEALGWLRIIVDGGYFPDDPYAAWEAKFFYGSSWKDGSWGQDYGCDGSVMGREGELHFYYRFPDYQYWYDSVARYHIGDLEYCSTALGCQWYYVLYPEQL
ncbi:MAG: hypothetical protein HZA17_00055 [Nitrospirae bacterium]|nr:hypothetical protein [Nitrospirota bacterium]